MDTTRATLTDSQKKCLKNLIPRERREVETYILLKNQSQRALISEAHFNTQLYSPGLWCSLTFEHGVKITRAKIIVKNWMRYVSRKFFNNRHIFYYGHYDWQPHRSVNSKKYVHFHIMMEVHGISPIEFNGEYGNRICELMNRSWRQFGDGKVEYINNIEAVNKYSRFKHRADWVDIACPMVQRRCRKHRSCLYGDNIKFLNRHSSWKPRKPL